MGFPTMIQWQTLQATRRRRWEAFPFSINTTSFGVSEDPRSRSADLVNVHYGGDKVRPRAKRHKCFSPPSEDAQPVGPTEHRPRGRRSGSEDRAFALGPCEELFGLLLLASVPLPRGRTQPSARARLMNQSGVSRSSVLPAMSSLTVST